MNNSASTVKKVVWVTVLVVVAVLVVFLVRWAMGQNLSSSNAKTSPYILELTNPVYSVSGKIEKINGQTLTLEVDKNMGAASIPTTPGTEVPKSKKIKFEIMITDTTQISQPVDTVVSIPDPNANNQNPKMTANDLKVGQFITVTSKNDLRLGTSKFNAETITLAPKMRTVFGQISAISGNTVTIKGMSVNGQQEYLLTVTDKTELLKRSLNSDPTKAAKTEDLDLADLSVGMDVQVIGESELVANAAVNAAKIEVSVSPISLPTGPNASGSASIPTPPPTTSQASSSADRN